jgi:hypothetical protein
LVVTFITNGVFQVKMEKKIIVPQGGKDTIDFFRDSTIQTFDLEACVAVGGVHENKGVLIHLTQISERDLLLDWFYQQVPVGRSETYLVGGMKGKAELFVKDLQERLRKQGYDRIRETVLTENMIDLYLRKGGAELHHFKQIKTPSGFEKAYLNITSL